MEAEIGVIKLQGKEWKGLLEEETRKDSSLESPEEAWSCQHLDLGLFTTVFRIVKRWITIVLSHQVFGHLLQQPSETNTETKILSIS